MPRTKQDTLLLREPLFPRWKSEIADSATRSAIAALARVGIKPLWIGPDFRNAVVLAIVSEGTVLVDEDSLSNELYNKHRVYLEIQHPPTYPLTMHLSPSLGVVRTPTPESEIQEYTFLADDLRATDEAIRRLYEMSTSYDRVATFALGGVGPMFWMLRFFQRPLILPGQTGDDWQNSVERWLKGMQEKFHIFAGLNWQKGKRTIPVKVFHEWISGLPQGATVLLFDTTFSGRAPDRILNELRAGLRTRSSGSISVTVVALYDAERAAKAGKRIPHATSMAVRGSDGSESVVSRENWCLPRLIAEDKYNLIGYQALKDRLALSAGWDAAVVRVRNNEGELVYCNVVSQVSGLLSNDLIPRTDWMPLSSDEARRCGWLGARTVVGNAVQPEQEGLVKAYGCRLITAQELVEGRKDLKLRAKGMWNDLVAKLKL